MVGTTSYDRSRSLSWGSLARAGLFTCGYAVVVLLGSTLLLQSYFADRILPGVTVAGQDIGSLTRLQATSKLRRVTSDYRLNYSIDSAPRNVRPADIGVRYDIRGTVDRAYGSRRSVLVPPRSERVELGSQIDTVALTAYVQGVARAIGSEPKDASVSVVNARVEVKPDQNGFSIDPVMLARSLRAQAGTVATSSLQFQAKSVSARLKADASGAAVTQAERFMAIPLALTYNGVTYTPAPREIGSWITFDKTSGEQPGFQARIDQSRLRTWVASLGRKVNVAPLDKRLRIENGVTKIEREGTDGTAIDEEPAVAALASGLSDGLPVTAAVTSHVVTFKTVSTSFVTLEYGRYIEINIAKQHLWVWQDHEVIYDTPITTGATGAGFPTITGLFSVYYKTTDTHLRGYAYGPRYNYDVQVDYWMPFSGGYGMHDASWRNGRFGGSDYYYGGSHGCVNLPDAAAAFIYNWVSIGTPVWVHAS